MSTTVRKRAGQNDGQLPSENAVLDTLAQFQSRIHSDPTDKPQTDTPARPASDTTSLTLSWDQIPPWQQDNEYIRTGYRRIQNSYRGCFASIFGYLHNETVNIHSHLFGGILFCALLASFRQTHLSRFDTATWADVVVFSIYLVAAATCLFCSALYHTCGVHSREVAASCNALDYTGIVVLIVGSFFPCVYYGFYCDPGWQAVYLSLISIAGLGAAYIVLNPEYRKPTHRGARTAVFIGLGLCGIVPVSHGLFSHGFWKLCYEMGFGWVLMSAVLYVAGALLYANRIPERFSPGTFDYFAASHQIFHVHVLLAALAHYMCILTAFDHWHSRNGACAT